jgi:membrane fusion protein, heavy metal efflux system
MKRTIFVIAITAITWFGFRYLTSSFIQKDSHEEEVAEEHEHEHEEEVDLQNISLSAQQVNTVDLKMDEVKDRELDATITANGALVLRAQNKGDVASLMGGIVKSVNVKEGQKVSKGQVVATVENTDVVTLQKEYFSASREARLARTEMERQQTLAQNGGGVKKSLQQAQKDCQVAEANLWGIGRQLQQMSISLTAVAKGHFTTVFPLRAPISGTVAEITASLGSFVDMQSPLMKIRNNSAVECDLNLFEKDINKVKNGDKVLLSLTNQPGVVVSGLVYGMNEYFNADTKSVAVHVKLDATRGAHLFDGMYVSGKIATGKQWCKALPEKAIVKTDGKSYIFALNQSPKQGKYVFSRHEVTTGVSEDGYTEVTLCKHIQKGQKIVTDNAFYLASLTGEHGEHDH